MNASHSMRLASLISLGAEVRSSLPRLGEEAREDWLDEGTKDDLGTAVTTQLVACASEGQRRCYLTQSEEEPSTRRGRT